MTASSASPRPQLADAQTDAQAHDPQTSAETGSPSQDGSDSAPEGESAEVQTPDSDTGDTAADAPADEAEVIPGRARGSKQGGNKGNARKGAGKGAGNKRAANKGQGNKGNARKGGKAREAAELALVAGGENSAQTQAGEALKDQNADQNTKQTPEQKQGRKPQQAPGQPADKPQPEPIQVPPTVQRAKRQGRHWMVILSFMLMVALPASVTGWYLWERAVDQYASHVGFSVRTEEKGSAVELLGAVTDLSGSSSTDTDILYEFLQGQELVAAIDAKLDLRAIWSKADPAVDPVFAYHPPGTIEDLVDHWERMVKIYYDSGTGLLDLRVLAFDPEDATALANEIYARANARINELSAVAREDAIGYAREELTQAEDRLREARVAIQAFRNRTQIIDPTIQTQTQSGLIGALETQLAEAQIERRLLEETARPNDPRIKQSELKIDVIRAQIAEERGKLGLEGVDGTGSVADLVGEYEALAVDLEFAQQAYTAARATFDAARNEARRQSRYLAPHVKPTKAEQSKYPDRPLILGLITLFLFLSWSVVVLVAYALRDRR